MNRVLARQLRRLGLSPEKLPDDLEKWQRLLWRVENSYEHADQSRYLLERSLTVATEELTEANRLLAERSKARLAASERRFRELFDRSPVPTWEENFDLVAKELDRLRGEGVEDLEGYLEQHPGALAQIVSLLEVTRVNPAVGQLVRVDDLGELLGPIDPSLVHDLNKRAWIEQLSAIWNGEAYVKVEPLVGHRYNGEMFHGILEWHAPRHRNGFDYSRVVVTIVDITARIEAERQLQEVLKSKDEFLASISHELRTPLTSVLGFAEVLRAMDTEAPEAERESLLDIIAAQAADLSDIVEDLLVAARAELGKLSVVAVPVDLYTEISQVLEARRDEQKPVAVRVDPSAIPKAIGDPQRVRQVLRNLVTNADRYGGDEVFIEADWDTAKVTVSVCDNGPGLSPANQEKVFERYYRSRQDGGQPGSVGIGLTISRELARLMGGDLRLGEGEGYTVFEFELVKAE